MNDRLAKILFLGVTLTCGGMVTARDGHDDNGQHNGNNRDDGPEFRARMSGDEEVPPIETDTRGRFQIEFKRDFTTAEFQLRIDDGRRVTQAHIHCAPQGTNGPIVAFLAGFHEKGWDVDGKWVRATLTDANIIAPAAGGPCPNTIANLSDLAKAMADGHAYVNAHTIANPTGEVRGQIIADDD
ncbi:MAG: CHRD domain-containing protein [Gammaproteobacteria bacterium]